MRFKISALLFIVIITTLVSVYALQKKSSNFKQEKSSKSFSVNNRLIKQRAKELKSYINNNGYEGGYCFIINMAIPSGKKRFFIYNLIKDSIEASGLVAHGSGSETKKGGLIFKNTPNSLASAKGKYKIGASYFGDYGLAFKLYGLDATNNKAYERFIVLHSHDCVPNMEVFPSPICVSWGCPTVSPQFLKILQNKIEKSSKPVLLDLQYFE